MMRRPNLFSMLMAGMVCICPGSSDAKAFAKGETIEYTIKQLGVRVGRAWLEYKGPVSFRGEKVELIQFTAKGPKFFDEEKIYVDPQTFKPRFVLRDLDIWGKKEKIEEKYLTNQGQIKITKTTAQGTSQQVIEKSGELDNIYGTIYHCRRQNNLALGQSIELALPTKDVSLVVAKKVKFKTAGKRFDSLYLKSKPKQYKIWFDTSEAMLPLRIAGAVGLANTVMTMRAYTPSGNNSHE